MDAQNTTVPGPGRVLAVNISDKKTVRKPRGTSGEFVYDRGMANDAHAGDWHRQVSLLAQESIDTMVAKGLDVGPGDFAENITTIGIDLLELPVGSVLKVGSSAMLEISQIGKVCHTKCAIYYQAGDCVMPREGLFAVVRTAGPVTVDDAITVVTLGDGTCDRVPADMPRPDAQVKAAALQERAEATGQVQEGESNG